MPDGPFALPVPVVAGERAHRGGGARIRAPATDGGDRGRERCSATDPDDSRMREEDLCAEGMATNDNRLIGRTTRRHHEAGRGPDGLHNQCSALVGVQHMVSATDLPISSLDEATITNGARDVIEAGLPYRMTVGIVGTAPLLMHAWNIQAVDEKAKAAKGSKAKKTDDIESYVYRDEDGHVGVPGMNFAASIQMAGKFMQDPRSPRKSAFDLCKAGVVPLTPVAPFQPLAVTWDYEHAARVTVQRAGITRIRPAMREGWRLRFDLLVTTPEYLSPGVMAALVGNAGRLIGICDFRPTYGRFAVEHMEATAA